MFLLSWLFYQLFKNHSDNPKIRSQVIINWTNNFLKPSQMTIDKIDDLIDKNVLKILVEQLWGDVIDDVSDPNLNEKELKIENMKNLIQYLKSKDVNIPDIKIKNLIEKKDLNKLQEIIWIIISNQIIDNTYFNGLRGKSGLLKWGNYINFIDLWENGKTMFNILGQFYPEELNNSILDQINDFNIFSDYLYTNLEKIGVPSFINHEYYSKLDEESIILQYSTLFNYLSQPPKSSDPNKAYDFNNTNQSSNNFYNYYNGNYLYLTTHNPDFNYGVIPENDFPNYNTLKNQVNQKINEHFRIKMRSRYPIQIAFIVKDGDNLKVIYNIPEFEEVIKRAGSRPIIFVACLGRYQQGKSTINSGITGNYGYKIGNGNKETTKGVYIECPYDINYLYQRFNISIRKDIYYDGNELLSPLVYFFDIEGYDGNMHGNDIEKNNKAYIEMCTPFLCLSSIFILLSEPNANAQEIHNFFERVKVSKLTTYSNTDDSNGALQLHIIFNKYYGICDDFDNKNNKNIKSTIQKFQKVMKNEWMGAKSLNKYGIKYEFYPLIYGLKPYYDNNLFFDVFQYFVKNIVRSIENAAEGKFLRSTKESIILFNYIIEHQNDPSFEEKIKLLIRSQHENSFETFSKISYEEAIGKIYPKIDKEFESFQDNCKFDININELKKKYIHFGKEIINKDLKVIQDHKTVFLYIEKLILSIRFKLNEKYNDLVKFKNELLDSFNDKIEQKADQLASNILRQIYDELTENANYNFNQKKIKKHIKEKIKQLKNSLIQFKKDENLFLLSDQKIDSIITEKQVYFDETIDKYINNEKIIEFQFLEENDMKSTLTKLYKKKIKSEYCYIEKQIITNLTNNLKNISFYQENFNHMFEICIQSQKFMMDYIISQKDNIMYDSCYKLKIKNDDNIIIIERLKQKNQLIINNDIIISFIDSNKNDLFTKITQIFDNAKYELAKFQVETRKTEVSFFRLLVETQTTTTYPDGTQVVGKWELIRVENKPFKEILNDAKDFIVSFFT